MTANSISDFSTASPLPDSAELTQTKPDQRVRTSSSQAQSAFHHHRSSNGAISWMPGALTMMKTALEQRILMPDAGKVERERSTTHRRDGCNLATSMGGPFNRRDRPSHEDWKRALFYYCLLIFSQEIVALSVTIFPHAFYKSIYFQRETYSGTLFLRAM